MLNWSSIKTGNRNLGTRRAPAHEFDPHESVVRHSFNIGDTQRIIIPIFKKEDGTVGPIVRASTVFRVKKHGVFEIPTKNSVFKPYSIKSMHPAAQETFEESLAIAKRGDICLFSELAYLQNADKWASIQAANPNLDSKNEADRKEIGKLLRKYEQEQELIRDAYYQTQETDADGKHIYKSEIESYLLVMVLDTEDVNGKQEVVKGENGLPMYQLQYLKASGSRLLAIETAIKEGLENEVIQPEDLHPFKEFEGTTDEVENNIGWVDLTLRWPKEETKMKSAQNLRITATNRNKSAVSDELIKDFEANNDKLYERAQTAFKYMFRNLQPMTRAEQKEILAPFALEEYERLVQAYPEDKARFEEGVQRIFNNIISAYERNEGRDSEATIEEAEPVKEEKAEAPKKAKAKAKKEQKTAQAEEIDSLIGTLLND